MVEVDFPGGADELAALYLSSFPPVVATLADLAETPERQAAFAQDLTEFFRAEYAAGGSATTTCWSGRPSPDPPGQSSSRQCWPTRSWPKEWCGSESTSSKPAAS